MRHREGGAGLILLVHSATALLSVSRSSALTMRQQRVVGSWASASATPSLTRSCFCRKRSTVSETSAAVASPAAAAQRCPRWCRLCSLRTTTSSIWAASPRCSSTGETRWRWETRADSRRRGLGALRATVSSSWAAVGDSASGEGDEKNPTQAARGGEESGETAMACRKAVAGISQVARRTGGSSPVEEIKLKEQKGPAWTEIVWDEGKGRFVGAKSPLDVTNTQRVRGAVGLVQLLVRHWFVPEDVTPDYYHFTIWRMFQRFVAGTVNVFGTQALLLALGIKSRRLGAAAAMSWVLKDALGKCGRILWASKMGRRFDSDAKRWRFRSSLLYAAGNGLEIITYVFPASFLILAAAANSFKQMSMLTSSATRNTIYRSFALKENIGDITAKGEAQIAVVDLLGILSGIWLCTMVGTSRSSILAAYVLLSMVDISAIYLEIRGVVFTVLNHERTHLLVRDYVACGSDPVAMAGAPPEAVSTRSPSPSTPSIVAPRLSNTLPNRTVTASAAGNGRSGKVETSEEVAAVVVVNGEKTGPSPVPGVGVEMEEVSAERPANPPLRATTTAGTVLQSSPSTVSKRENIFMPSRLTTHSFKSWSKVGMNMEDVKDLLVVFGDERYMLAYTEGKPGGGMRRRAKKGAVSIILHKEATGTDTIKSMLAREYMIDELARAGYSVVGAHSPPSRLGKQSAINGGCAEVSTRSSEEEEGDRGNESEFVTMGWRHQQKQQQKYHLSRPELLRCLEVARRRASEGAPGFFAALEALGWSTEKFMFGNIQTKVEWTV